jgi:LuxR family maltose regulon positive regulatory protein
MALARLRLAQGRPDEARRLLQHQAALAEAGGRNGRLIEILCLSALALETLGQADDAVAALSRAISLARPEGYRRVFLDLGSPLDELLNHTAGPDATDPVPGAIVARIAGRFLRELLDAFQQEREALSDADGEAATARPAPAQPSMDPLTERELEVLELLAEGLSNKEIANRLVVAPSTVKQHLKNMYGKLEVHSRIQAVARGRELNLL